MDALNSYVPICVVICYLKILYSLYHQLPFLVGRFWIKLNCMVSFLQNSRPLHRSHWDKRFLKIGQPYHSITQCARQLSEWSQNKKNSLEIFYVYFMEILYFRLDYLFIYLFISCQYNMIFVLFTTRIFVIIRIWWVLYLDVFLLILPTIAVILFQTFVQPLSIFSSSHWYLHYLQGLCLSPCICVCV